MNVLVEKITTSSERLPGEEAEVLSCSSPAVTLLLLSSVEIFGNSLCPEAFFFWHTIYYAQYISS
jgi:hypothetical protein